MAEVLCPLIPSSGPTTSIQEPRSTSPPQNSHAFSQPRQLQMQRNPPNGNPGYRGTSPAPTYAFKATPMLKNNNENRSAIPAQPPSPGSSFPPLSNDNTSAANRQRFPGSPSISTTNSSSTSSSAAPHKAAPTSQPAGSTWSSLFKSNDSLSQNFQLAPFSTDVSPPLGDSLPAPSTAAALTDGPSKPSPDRYRRGHRRVETAGAGTAASEEFGDELNGSAKAPAVETNVGTDVAAETPVSAGAEQNAASQASASFKRYRRRSSGSTLDKAQALVDDTKVAPANDGSASLQRPSSSRQDRPSSPSGRPRTEGSSGPARTFAEVARRTNTPSPLSRPMTPSGSQATPASPSSPPDLHASTFQHSPAVAAMAALNERDGQKGSKSRFRRAFSFGSSAELKRATDGDAAANRAQARKEQFSNELDEEQDAIAKQQEAAGLGENIYSGQAGFIGSTDNLSISSTASSASLMLRKMGRGMKKGGRSIKGLFRPKSAIGVAPPDGPLGASIGDISRVTVEAEREKVNVNANPHDQTGGGTGFPKLERNSYDAVRSSMAEPDGHNGLRSTILAGEHERQEVLASVRRGILKRTNTSSPQGSPVIRASDATLSNNSFDRRPSPAPSNTSSEVRNNGHGRNESNMANGHDYFSAGQRMGNQSSRSLPGTPRGMHRNISFSPRLQFHDVWSSTDYDRRGDIATCNRLTPMLAQQIKEELNSFKMEMEVHEASKPHTHFF